LLFLLAWSVNVLEAGEFANLPGVDRFEAHDATISFTVSDSMNEVIRLAGQRQVVTFDAERPPLEEIFLTYYGNGQA